MRGAFFVERPVFAWVIALVIMLAGAASISSLPIAQYPDVAPPTINIAAMYPGANAETVENSVTKLIEQQLTGLDGLLYFSSASTADGGSSIDVTFAQGTDPDTAQVQVQNKVQQAMNRMPVIVQQLGVNVTKSQRDYLMVVVLYDALDRSTDEDVADALASSLMDAIGRTQGVGDIQLFGSPYAMRIWLNPEKLAAYQLMPSDVEAAIRAQNTEVSAGQIGALPVAGPQQLTATVTAQGKLQTPGEFRDLILKTSSSGAIVRLSDVARVELGSESYTTIRRLDGHTASGLAVKLAPGSNALETAKRVRATVDGLKSSLPDGYEVAYARDSTEFIEISISEVVKTLIEAIVLVVIVMFVFLQSWRATIIPAIAVPVVLLGTFAVLLTFGYSINTLTMFGLVLSIGLLVDDAIVVVENVERLMEEEGLSAREATIKSMQEIRMALIGIAAVLAAVFLPMAFFSGSTGVIYRQFSITVVSSMVLSVIVALTLTPTLCATLLKPRDDSAEKKGFFGWFDRMFERGTKHYVGSVGGVLRRPWRFMLLTALVVGGTAGLLMNLPTGFIPNEDQGQIIVQFTLPVGATFERSQAVADEVRDYFVNEEKDAVDRVFTIAGFNFGGRGQNVGLAFVGLHDWGKREADGLSASAVAARATQNLSQRIHDARVYALSPAPVSGLGRTLGFEFQLQAAPGVDREQLIALRDELMESAQERSELTNVRMNGLPETPQLKVHIDEAQAAAQQLSLGDVNDTLSSAWAGLYVNDFIDRGRVKKVYIQGDAEFRSKPEDLNDWFVRNAQGTMTPFSTFATTEWTYGPESLNRYNGLAAYELQGAPAAGVSSGQAMDLMAQLASALPPGSTYDWSGLSYQQKLSGGQTTMLYAASVIVVFLCLAALYESWSVPLSVLLVIPLGLLGAAAAAWLRDLENDVYFQVALVTIIGLAARNAILIVEFAEAARQRGEDLHAAAMEAARLRLRPILMTALSFAAGVIPLALSTGAGANSRVSIGTGILGGTLSSTLLSIVLVPLFFVVVSRLFSRSPKGGADATPPAQTEGGDA